MLSRLLFVCLAVVTVTVELYAQPKGHYRRSLSDPIVDSEKGDEVLNTFRTQRLQGDFLFLFDISQPLLVY